MTAYLMMQRGTFKSSDADVYSGSVLFHMWQKRQQPFSLLSNGDTIYAVDGGSRTIRWEFRVANLVAERYESPIEAFKLLRDAFGVSPADCTEYVWSHPYEGWLLAYSTEVIRPLSIPLPDDLNFVKLGGRNGWVDLDKLDARTLSELALPAEGAPVVIPAVPHHDATNVVTSTRRGVPKPDRYVPMGVKQLVLTRDRRRCRACGRSDAEMRIHFDHIYPWSKGGPNSPDNLQILCDKCNLKKGAKVLPGIVRPSDAWDSQALADDHDNIKRLRSESAAGNIGAAYELAAIVGDEEEAERLIRFVVDSHDPRFGPPAAVELAEILAVRGDDEEARALADRARSTGDANTASLAAYVLSTLVEPSPERTALLEEAMTSNEQWCRSYAALLLADPEQIDDERRRDLLEEAMKSPDSEVRAEAALELAGLTDDASEREQLLYESLGSEDQSLREESMIVLALTYYDLGNDRAANSLLELATRSMDPDIAAAARSTLDELYVTD